MKVENKRKRRDRKKFEAQLNLKELTSLEMEVESIALIL